MEKIVAGFAFLIAVKNQYRYKCLAVSAHLLASCTELCFSNPIFYISHLKCVKSYFTSHKTTYLYDFQGHLWGDINTFLETF